MCSIVAPVLVLAIICIVATDVLAVGSEDDYMTANAGCACIGDILSFTCTVVGLGSTIWKGSAFVCPTAQNQIVLRHSEFNRTDLVLCGGDIVATRLRVDGDCFTSQLSVNISDQVNNTTVMCAHNSIDEVIFLSTIRIVSGPFVPPSDIDLVDISDGQLVFEWSQVKQGCSSTVYLLNSSGCGVCLNTTNVTRVTCSGLQPAMHASVCTIRVQSMICGYVSSQSNPVSVRMQVPAMPSVKVHGHNNLSLTVDVTQNDIPFNITATMPAFITLYHILFYDSSFIIMSSNRQPCGKVTCEYYFNLPSLYCDNNTRLSITVSAVNQLGEGPPSDSSIIGLQSLCPRSHTNKVAQITIGIIVSIVIILIIVIAGVIVALLYCYKKKKLDEGNGSGDNRIIGPDAHNGVMCEFQRFEYTMNVQDKIALGKCLKKPETLLAKKKQTRDKENVVAIETQSKREVGHIPIEISKICSDFITQGGTIECEIIGSDTKRRGNTMTDNQIEAQCRYTVSTNSEELLKKVTQALSHVIGVKMV